MVSAGWNVSALKENVTRHVQCDKALTFPNGAGEMTQRVKVLAAKSDDNLSSIPETMLEEQC